MTHLSMIAHDPSMLVMGTFAIIWLICLSWQAIPDIIKAVRSVKVPGTVTNIRTEMTVDGQMYFPDVTFVDLNGQTKTAKTSAGTGWKHWRIGDPARIMIGDDGTPELYWPAAFYGGLCVMYGGGIILVGIALQSVLATI